jgi:large subunit ribosomal protein L5|tara:strand:+ start:5901 stop:6449 length:549 start_codon:yes stop_codon:yes gene_type:complete
MVTKLRTDYKEKIIPSLYKSLNCTNIHQVPKLVKIKVNRGLGLAAQNTAVLNKTINEFRVITGQQPVITLARNSVATFKVREEMPLGVTVTLRGDKMYSFLDRFINVALPRSRDFQGLKPQGFDKFGNYTVGLTEQLLFPEISYDSVDQARGFNITFVTNAKTREEGAMLLREFGLPIREKI